jgi:hypothetical protein
MPRAEKPGPTLFNCAKCFPRLCRCDRKHDARARAQADVLELLDRYRGLAQWRAWFYTYGIE